MLKVVKYIKVDKRGQRHMRKDLVLFGFILLYRTETRNIGN